jgi:ABC-2 type transport system ATP-binding protein/lipopolysaccharide transport system ATP-binding protein
MSPNAIEVRSLSKKFRLHSEKRNSLKERFVRGKAAPTQEFWALRDATFDIERGTTFALVGHNGSGKSTALKVLAGIHRPTSGSYSVNGRVSALLELGAGFHGELTGRENIYLNGAILGMTRRQIDAAMDSIIDFSGIGDFIDTPVKVYSSGMYVRLGFSIAVTLDPEILVIDEVIAVGDEEFQRKCFDHLYRLRQGGTTIVLVSHSLGLVSDLCDRAVWLDHGRIRSLGPARDVVQQYLDEVNAQETGGRTAHAASPEDQPRDGEDVGRRGTGEVRIVGLEFLGPQGEPVPFLLTGDEGTVRMRFRARESLPAAVLGLGFVHESGVTVAGPNSGVRPAAVPIARGEGYVDYHLPRVPLQPGNYRVSAAVVHQGHIYDYADRRFELVVRGGGEDEPGLTRFFGEWSTPTYADEAQQPPISPSSSVGPVSGPATTPEERERARF